LQQQLAFCGESYPSAVNYMGLSPEKLSELLGMEVTTLLGADVLAKYRVLFDYRNRRVQFSQSPIPFGGERMAITKFMGIPILELEVDGRQVKYFLDTGAKLSYLNREITLNHARAGTEEDFYPGVGRFSTDVFSIPTRLNGDSFTVKYGNLPPILQSSLMMAGTQGIIGYDFFNAFKVMLDLDNHYLEYKSHED
jgi:hypothetical protein